MNKFLYIIAIWLFVFFIVSMTPKKYGSYIHWNDVKGQLQDNPELNIIDFQTGLSWNVIVSNENVLGSFHADVEPKSIKDHEIATQLFSGFSWTPRPVLVLMPDGQLVAASIHNMPHAGVEEEPYLKLVKNRTGGYGEGLNRDYVKNNGMSGHVCLHFLGSKSHKTQKEVLDHQNAIKMAANIISK